MNCSSCGMQDRWQFWLKKLVQFDIKKINMVLIKNNNYCSMWMNNGIEFLKRKYLLKSLYTVKCGFM